MVDVDESQVNDKSISPGKLLLAGRERSGLTQEQVAKELYMTVSKVAALEADDYGRLISDTFARGYIRAYASFLKLDVVAILAAYDVLTGEDKSPISVAEAVQPAKKAGELGQKGAWQFLAVIVVFLVGLWLISVWFFDNRADKLQEARYLVPSPNIAPVVISSEEIARMRAAASAAASPETTSVSSSTTGTLVTANSGQLSNSSVATNSPMIVGKAVTANSAQSVSSTASESAAAALSSLAGSSMPAVKKTTLDEVSFSFSAESWLEVSDSRGDVLATELQPAGSRIKLVGQAPFDVKLGNAPAVDIQLNGKKVDVIPLLGTNVLIMKVGN